MRRLCIKVLVAWAAMWAGSGVLWGTGGAPQGVALTKEGSGLEGVTLQLKWRHQFQFAGYYAAIAQGYYREAGLDVRLVEAEPGKDPVEVVLRGEAEFGVGTSELVLLRAKGEPVVVLAAIFQHSPLVLIAKGAGADTDLQGLHDRPMMIEPQSAELFAYFKNEGIDPNRLKVVPHTFSVDDLLEGKVGAMTGYSTDEPFLLQQAGLVYSVFSPRAGGIDFYGDNLFTTEELVRRRPAMVKAFREASLRGWDYALAHPEEIIALIMDEYRSVKTLKHLRFEAERTAQLMHPGLIQVGHMNPGRWRHMADTYAEFGMLESGFPVGSLLYDPDPKMDPRVWYWALGVSAAVAVAALGWVAPLVRLNRRLRRGEREYRQLAENAPFPVMISDKASGRLMFVNRLAADLLGGKPEEFFSRRAVEIYAEPVDRAEMLCDLEEGRKAAPREVKLRARDGRELWTLFSAAQVIFDGREGIVVAFHDITARRAMQEELRDAKEAAESANTMRSRYLAVMSHEIRTPMSGIHGLTDMMLSEKEGLTAEQRENLVMMREAAQSLMCLVSEMLDWSQLEAGAMLLDEAPVMPADFLRQVTGLFRPATEARGVEMKVEVATGVPALVFTDPLRLRQILSNLLSNAVKFTKRGTVRVGLSGVRIDEGRWRLRFAVSDTGPGIAPEVQAKLFAPYVQADAAVAREFGGSGLGLSISRSLARLMGGDITLQSSPGRGSTFILEIVAEEGDE